MADVDWAILCDYAFQDVGRKTCLIGTFDRIYTKVVPAQHHHAALVIRFTGEPDEEVKFRIEIVRPLGSGGGAMGATFATVKLSATGTGEFITNWAGFPLPDYGNYSFNIHIADNLSKVVPFAVARRTVQDSGHIPPQD